MPRLEIGRLRPSVRVVFSAGFGRDWEYLIRAATANLSGGECYIDATTVAGETVR